MSLYGNYCMRGVEAREPRLAQTLDKPSAVIGYGVINNTNRDKPNFVSA